MSLESEIIHDMEGAIDHLHQELKSLRTGRANPAILDQVMVEVYGTQMHIKELGNVTVPESRQLLITPYDPQNTQTIAKAIENANLNLQTKVDNNAIRIMIPQMDESIRKDMVKQCKKKAEEGKVSVREIRRKYNEQIKKQKSSGEMPEDLFKQKEKKIQELTDKHCKMIDDIAASKEKEILEI